TGTENITLPDRSQRRSKQRRLSARPISTPPRHPRRGAEADLHFFQELLRSGGLCLGPVVLRMKLGRLARMVRRMLVMPMRCMRMMAGAFVIACLMPLGRV